LEKFKAFENWLIERQNISRGTLVANMEIIDKTLKVKDFENIKSVHILQRLISEFKTNRSFVIRSRVEKTSILGSFALYILFIESKKVAVPDEVVS
jgi:hypothetical protein